MSHPTGEEGEGQVCGAQRGTLPKEKTWDERSISDGPEGRRKSQDILAGNRELKSLLS